MLVYFTQIDVDSVVTTTNAILENEKINSIINIILGLVFGLIVFFLLAKLLKENEGQS
jgi:hypothetical protein